ncbi:hypothetical protein [Nocardioides coralli]|uniref:hypothetical protein n=1 Tax=Nocardioides coralli TaxID=2872154 RepID=UPI001CA3D061|nr:hypothetical protein [Nocardioides coralli]QZY28879.1 hypothetical protein K6T13_15745 [Nocardioides coralli]
MSETAPRPSHTTVAAAVVIGGSVGVVVGVADQLSGLYSLENREAVASFLSEPPGDGLGLDVPGALRLLRVALMVVAGCATAAAILGYHVLRRSHRARLGLTLLAAPLFIGGLATGGFLTSLVAASSLLLWLGPSGEWFRGETPGRRAGAGSSVPDTATTARPDPWGAGSGAPTTSDPPPRTGAPAWPTEPPRARRRPDALVWACVLTWAVSSVVLLTMLASVALLVTNTDLVLDELQRQGREVSAADLDLLRTATYVTVGVGAVWTVAAMLLAVAAYRGVGWGRVALVVSAVASAVLCLLAALTSLLTLIPGVVSLVTVLLLNRPEVRAWFRRDVVQ